MRKMNINGYQSMSETLDFTNKSRGDGGEVYQTVSQSGIFFKMYRAGGARQAGELFSGRDPYGPWAHNRPKSPLP